MEDIVRELLTNITIDIESLQTQIRAQEDLLRGLRKQLKAKKEAEFRWAEQWSARSCQSLAMSAAPKGRMWVPLPDSAFHLAASTLPQTTSIQDPCSTCATKTGLFVLPCNTHRLCHGCLFAQVKRAVLDDGRPIMCQRCRSRLVDFAVLQSFLPSEPDLVALYRKKYHKDLRERAPCLSMCQTFNDLHMKRQRKKIKHQKRVKRGFRTIKMERKRLASRSGDHQRTTLMT